MAWRLNSLPPGPCRKEGGAVTLTKVFPSAFQFQISLNYTPPDMQLNSTSRYTRSSSTSRLVQPEFLPHTCVLGYHAANKIKQKRLRSRLTDVMATLVRLKVTEAEVFLGISVLKICRRTPTPFSIKLLCNFIEIAFRHGCSAANLVHIFIIPFLFLRTLPLDGCF